MLRGMKWILLFVSIVGYPTLASATTIQYTITLDVTNVSGFVNAFLPAPYSFPAVPATFVGTFDADNTAAGAVSNFQLVVGGLDIATTYDKTFLCAPCGTFDPITRTLQYDFPGRETDVLFGRFGGPISGRVSPADYAVAIENDITTPPLGDPFLDFVYDWSGTYGIVPTAEPSTAMLIAAGLLFVFVIRARFARSRLRGLV